MIKKTITYDIHKEALSCHLLMKYIEVSKAFLQNWRHQNSNKMKKKNLIMFFLSKTSLLSGKLIKHFTFFYVPECAIFSINILQRLYIRNWQGTKNTLKCSKGNTSYVRMLFLNVFLLF